MVFSLQNIRYDTINETKQGISAAASLELNKCRTSILFPDLCWLTSDMFALIDLNNGQCLMSFAAVTILSLIRKGLFRCRRFRKMKRSLNLAVWSRLQL